MKAWYLLSLSVSCLIFRSYSSESPSERSDRNRFYEIERALSEALDIYQFEGTDCYQVMASFEEMTGRMDVVLIWEERIIELEEGLFKWGETNRDTIWIYTPMCSDETIQVFFHEIGHVMLHYDGIIRPKRQKEDEANLFSVEIRRRLDRLYGESF